MKKKKKSSGVKPKPKNPNRYPMGWDARSIKALADHYDNQSDEEAVA